jgi:hypothetical protein
MTSTDKRNQGISLHNIMAFTDEKEKVEKEKVGKEKLERK